ncbi:MAG: penicillin-binding protein 2 [Candidatus Omnitrophica bacterium]|nr:penicillin-binding protein 2 [Candidatus Omnitrophota bacterium]MBU4346114.1 penicillin-binding protein 2 [Candidatus Omnitrophota bacterium]MBU4473563.1 penicillin-binding protein 2 [Candidatus Omnitrophota bacterium]MCG2706280.1 penicillin-binding protein 2 [Candidatus Omnitrophota bacterium]
MRTKIVNSAVIFVFLFLAFGLFNLQVIQGNRYRELSNKNCIRLLPQPGTRGRILDRQGNIIVDNYLSYDVMILPQEEKGLEKSLTKISGVLGRSPQDLKEAFNSGFTVPFLPVTVAKNIDLKKVFALEELKPGLANIIIQPHPQRVYPYKRLACHVLGYLNEIDHWRLRKLADYGYKAKDIVGFGGVEEKYDYYLRQEEGGSSVEVDHRGRIVRLLGFRPPQSGKDIQLTLDLKIQKIAEDKLRDKKGSVILMEPYTGEILALANNPNFAPSIFMEKSEASITNLFNNPHAPLINRAISGLYPAGSVFKLILATAALETGKINPETTFSCPGTMHIGRQEFSCWDRHNQQNLYNAITHSCNIFFYRTGLLLGAQLIHNYALKFGLSKPTGVELPYEAGGFVPSPLLKRIYKFQNWFDGDTANLSIGQGELLVTPLQISRMMAVFANKGILITPYIVKAIEGQRITSQRKITRVPIKESTIDYIRGALKNVIADPNGTGNVLSNLSVSVAGKTGTAQVAPGQKSHGWFAGFFPFENPKFVICVLLEHGGSGFASCVLAREIIEAMIKEGVL